MISIITLFACMDIDKNTEDTGEDTGSNVTDVPEFVGMDFLLESSEGYQPVSERISIGFSTLDGEELSFHFSASCNSIDGNFFWEDGVMNVQGVGMTHMGCDQELMEEDEWFVEFWNSGPSLVLDEDLLTISDGTNTFYFRDSEVVTPDLPLVGNLWVIDTFIDGDVVSAFALENDPSVQFSGDGTVVLDTGCNAGGGSYMLNGSTISVEIENWTGAACNDEMSQEAENYMSQVFDGDIELEIDANRIHLMNGSVGVSGTAQ